MEKKKENLIVRLFSLIERLSDEEKDELNDFFREKEIKYGV